MDTDTREYALDNASNTAARMLACLTTVLDPYTQDLLAPLIPDGGRCLELGAGNGSIACWMAERAGPHGNVVAVDRDPRHVRDHPAVSILTADVTAPDGLPGCDYDLIHARLLLAHLPQRGELMHRLASRLAPGGHLVVEEWGQFAPPGTAQVLWHPEDSGLPDLYRDYQQALLELFRRAGNDTTWCARAASAMRVAGLVDVRTSTYARSWAGGTAGTMLPCCVSAEKEAELAAAGMPVADQRRMRELLADPQTLLLGNPIWSTVGRRPGGAR
ncbi:MAG TPA: methyltransferase domain-containing protein [Kribbellaceae bacterium]|nr:methyltransferase domain-containing protein [Kribbellaceae bacterium]